MNCIARVTSQLAAACLTIAGLALGNAATAHASTVVSGQVMCVDQRSVVGVWIAAGSGGSGWASTTNINGYTKRYSYALPYGGSYAVNVGCGGTSQNWATNNKSGYVSGTYNNFTCYDSPSAYYYYLHCQRA
jgi:hypothetical protein